MHKLELINYSNIALSDLTTLFALQCLTHEMIFSESVNNFMELFYYLCIIIILYATIILKMLIKTWNLEIKMSKFPEKELYENYKVILFIFYFIFYFYLLFFLF